MHTKALPNYKPILKLPPMRFDTILSRTIILICLYLIFLALSLTPHSAHAANQDQKLAVQKIVTLPAEEVSAANNLAVSRVKISESLKSSRPYETSHEETAKHLRKFHSVELTASEKLWLDSKEKIVVAFDGDFPPYSFINENGEFEGIAVDITRRLARRLGIELEIYPHGQWPVVYAAGQNRDADMIAALAPRPYRKQWFEFTRPYITLSNYVITRTENVQQYKQLAALKGQKVLAFNNSVDTEELLRHVPDIDLEYISDYPAALERVSIGEAEATVGDISVANFYISRRGLSNLALSANLAREERLAFGVRNDWPQLAGIFDKALETLSHHELNEIYAHWFVPQQVKPDAGFLSVFNVLTNEEKKWLDEHPVIRLASDSTWPPFETIDKNGRYAGICADYITLIAERLNIQLDLSPTLGWHEIQRLVRDKKLDVFPCITHTINRKSFALFTDPYVTHPMMMITREDIGYVDSLVEVLDQSIAVEKGYAAADFLARDYPGLDLVLYKSSMDAMLAVSKGESFAYVGNIATTSYVARENGITNIKVSGQLPYNFDLSLGVRNDWPILVSILQKALDSISLEERVAINQKWINISVEQQSRFPTLLVAIVAGLILFIGIAGWRITRR